MLQTVTKSASLAIGQRDRRDGVVVRGSASQVVDRGFITLVEPYQDFKK